MEILHNEPVASVIVIFFILIAIAYRYAMNLIKNDKPALDQIHYQIVSMEHKGVYQIEGKVIIQLHGKMLKSNEVVIIDHPIPNRVWEHQENYKQAVNDQYGLENNPMVDVRIETDDHEKYLIVDGRF